MPCEHGDDHREALRIDAGGHAPGHREVGLCDEGLHLEQDRPRTLERAGHCGARLAVDGSPEDLGRVRDADEPRARHLEHADLVRRAEPVLDRSQHAVGAVAVALELEDTIDEVLQHARPSDGPVFRDMPDENRHDPGALRDPQQACRRLADLRHRAWRRA